MVSSSNESLTLFSLYLRFHKPAGLPSTQNDLTQNDLKEETNKDKLPVTPLFQIIFKIRERGVLRKNVGLN